MRRAELILSEIFISDSFFSALVIPRCVALSDTPNSFSPNDHESPLASEHGNNSLCWMYLISTTGRKAARLSNL